MYLYSVHIGKNHDSPRVLMKLKKHPIGLPLLITLPIMFLVAVAVSHGQRLISPRVLYVTFDGARAYDRPDVRSGLRATFVRGDSIHVIAEKEGYVCLSLPDGEAWMLVSNVGSSPPDNPGRRELTFRNAERTSASSGSSRSQSDEAAVQQTQCRETTRAGRRCSRTTDDPSGYCWQHRKR